MRYLIAVLALAGLVISSFALREHYRTTPAPCDINERWDCGAVNHSPFAVIGGIGVPTLVVVGSEDQVTTPADAEFIAGRIRGARVSIIDDAAHNAPIERPAEVNAAIEDFLKELG